VCATKSVHISNRNCASLSCIRRWAKCAATD
jgi:hypothetical protein